MSRNLFIAILALVLTVASFTSCSGNGEKEFEEGMKSYKAEQYETAFKLFEKGADCGHAGARTYLGMCYALGRGVERNDAKGVELIREAAEQGYAEAQKNSVCVIRRESGSKRTMPRPPNGSGKLRNRAIPKHTSVSVFAI